MDRDFSANPFMVAREQLIHVVDYDVRTCEIICTNFKLEGYEVTFSTSIDEAQAKIARREPHAVILNVSVDGKDGIEALRFLRSCHRGMPIVMIQDVVDLESAVTAMKEGASDVLAKPIDAERLLGIVRRSLRAEVTINREGKRISIEGFKALTGRERQVLQSVVDGRTNKQAGLQLGISPRTVEGYRARVMKKLGVRNAADLIRVVLTS